MRSKQTESLDSDGGSPELGAREGLCEEGTSAETDVREPSHADNGEYPSR